MRPKVSVIIPFAGEAGLLRACVDSLRDQLQSGDQLIVVLDPPDQPAPWLKDLVEAIDFGKCQGVGGHGGACNEGARLAKNEYLVFCDHDITLRPDWLEALWACHSHQASPGATASCLLNPHVGGILDFGIAYSRFNGAHTFQDLPYNHALVANDIRRQSVCSAGMLIAKEVFEGVGGFDELLIGGYTDVDLCARLRRMGYGIAAAHAAAAYHFGGEVSLRRRNGKSGYRKGDAKAYFAWKNSAMLSVDLDRYIAASIAELDATWFSHGPFRGVSLMNVLDPFWYVAQVENAGLQVQNPHWIPDGRRDADRVGLVEELGHDWQACNKPIAYFVDRFPSIQGNVDWWARRAPAGDLVIDRHGNVLPADTVISWAS